MKTWRGLSRQCTAAATGCRYASSRRRRLSPARARLHSPAARASVTRAARDGEERERAATAGDRVRACDRDDRARERGGGSRMVGPRRRPAAARAKPSYANATGALGILNTAGTIDTRDHPFFAPLGTNGRGCVTCHQPADAMALSVATVRERWDATGGQDPLFAAIDGRNCPHLPAGDPAAHSLLLTRGLIRVASAVAAARRRRRGAARRIHARGRARSHGLQHAPRLRPAVAAADRVRVPPAAPRREHEVPDAQQLRRRPVHRQERLAGRARSRHGLADEHEHDGRRAGDDAEGASRRCGAHAPRAAARPRAATPCKASSPSRRRSTPRRRATRRPAISTGGPPGFGPRNLAAAPAGVLGNNTTRYVFPLGDAWPADRTAAAARARSKKGAPRSRAVTTCSCSARSSSATRCT